jgi:electron transfer flavoprotein beta subunit
MGSFDQKALELGLVLRASGDAELFALSVGERAAQGALRESLAVGADDVMWIRCDPTVLGAQQVAELLAAAIRRLDGVDLILCGYQGEDWGSGQIAPHLAEALGCALASMARSVRRAADGYIHVMCESDAGLEELEVRLPAVVSCADEPTNQLRVPTIAAIMLAGRRDLKSTSPEELGFSVSKPLTQVRRLRPMPSPARRGAEMLEAGTVVEQASILAERIVEMKRVG